MVWTYRVPESADIVIFEFEDLTDWSRDHSVRPTRVQSTCQSQLDRLACARTRWISTVHGLLGIRTVTEVWPSTPRPLLPKSAEAELPGAVW
jgi:hypothetical protein